MVMGAGYWEMCGGEEEAAGDRRGEREMERGSEKEK